MLSKSFILAGDATFTIEPPAGSAKLPHYTYRIQKVEASDRWPEAWFVSFLNGPDNESDYAYLGKLHPGSGKVMLTKKSSFSADAYRVRLLDRILSRIWAEDHAAYEQHGFKVHHEGKCGRCGRKLTVPDSIESGIGPDCREKMVLAGEMDW